MQVGLTRTRAIVLHSYRYSETSKILKLMTAEMGPCTAMAKGALRPRSRFGSVLEPFTEGEALLFVKEGREMHTLSSFEPNVTRLGLARGSRSFVVAAALCELVMRRAPEQRDEHLFDALGRGLEALRGAEERDELKSPAAGLEHVWSVLSVLGFGPDLRVCGSCGGSFRAGEGVRLDLASGRASCPTCCSGRTNLSPAAFSELTRLLSGLPARTPAADGTHDEPKPGQHERLLAAFARRHLPEGARLNSLEFLTSLN